MAKFTTRVELHGADSEDYNTLYEWMEYEGFTKTITDTSTGKVYEMPEAEYNIEGEYTRVHVLNKAKAAVRKTQLACSILVTQSGGRRWYNLPESD